MGLAEALAGVMLVALVVYAVSGGADFGGGVWDLFASGPRADAQRRLIEHALAPVWETNHVWLILIVVVLFTAFPPAFAAVSVGLHIPLTLMLLGIVFRGSAFVFRKYDEGGGAAQRRWGRVFAVSSVVSPFFLGVSLGAITSGALEVPADADFVARYVTPWTRAFPVSVGLFGLALFALVAAVYLTVEATDLSGEEDGAALARDFRRRALIAAAASLVLGVVTTLLATSPALDVVRARWSGSASATALAFVAFAAWAVGVHSLVKERYRRARVATITLVALVIVGWASGQYPYLVRSHITIESAAAPLATLRPVAIALAAGALVLFPTLYWLFRVFKTRDARRHDPPEGPDESAASTP